MELLLLEENFNLKNKRNDLNYKLIRGNVDTRINKLNENLYDAIILSYAGINSLNLEMNIFLKFFLLKKLFQVLDKEL